MLRALILATASLSAAVLAIPVLAAPSAQTVRVTETNFRISLSAKPKAGAVRFVVRNSASGVRHDFWLKGGGKTWKTRVLPRGGTASLSATLKKGVKYAYWCGVGGHAAAGMKGGFVAR